MRGRSLALVLVASLAPALAAAQAEADKLRAAKALFLDRQYAEARQMLQSVRASGRPAEAQQALYWTARCSDGLGESERALAEYGDFLASRPADRTLAEEARTNRIALAVKLAKNGKPQHLALAREALSDPSRTVRYSAGLLLGALGPAHGRPAIPVLKEILAKETDEDLVGRAKLYLLRLDPDALAGATGATHSGRREATWVRVRIYEKGSKQPQVAINLPVAFAELIFKSLPADTRKELQLKGYDADTFWDRLKKTGPTDILTIEGDEGERVQVWIE